MRIPEEQILSFKKHGIRIIHCILFFLILINQVGKYHLPNTYVLFWPLFILFVITSYLSIKWCNPKYRLLFAYSCYLMAYLIIFVNYPAEFHIGRDSSFEVGYSEILSEDKIWDPEAGNGFAENYYGYNPVFHIILSHLSLTTGISTFITAKYIYSLILGTLFFFSTNALVKSVFEKSYDQALAMIIIAISPCLLLGTLTRRMPGAIGLIWIIISVIKINENKDRLKWLLIFFMSASITILSDHSMSWLSFVFMTGFFIFNIILRYPLRKLGINLKAQFSNIYSKASFILVLLLTWEGYIAIKLFTKDANYFQWLIDTIKNELIGTEAIYNSTQIGTITGNIYMHNLFETAIAYISQGTFLLIGSLGLLLLLKHLKDQDTFKKEHMPFVLYYGIFGIAMHALCSILKITSIRVMSNTFIWFSTISVAILAAYVLNNITIKMKKINLGPMIICILLVLFHIGSLFSSYHPSAFARSPNDMIPADYMESKNEWELDAMYWTSDNTDETDNIAGGYHVFEIFGGIGNMNMVRPRVSKRFYIYNQTDIERLLLNSNHNITAFAANKLLFESSSSLLGEPADQEQMEVWNNVTMWDRVYENDGMIVYMKKE